MNPEIIDLGGGIEENGKAARVQMRWTNVMSSFVLRRMSDLVKSRVRSDKGFKEVHYNKVAKELQEFSGNDVSGTQVYNHLRKWRQRWIKVSKLRDLSGANWDEDNHMIVLEEEHYMGHIKAHPKDTEYLNKPIENYKVMMNIFGSGIATGKYSMGSNEPLGDPSEFMDNSIKDEPDEAGTPANDEVSNMTKKQAKDAASDSKGAKKRKRSLMSDEETVMLSGMTEAVNNVATAIRDTAVHEVHPGLYGAVMNMTGYSENALFSSFTYLVDNKAQGAVFVTMNENHRVMWLNSFCARNNIE